MGDAPSISYGLAFIAGLLSFLSPCVLPLAPSYVTFITGMSIEDLATGDRRGARRQAALHALLFILGFSLIFVALGATATVLGVALRRSLPLLQQVGGIVVGAFGLYLVGVLRIPSLMRERRVHLATKPTGKLGTVVVGIAFAAGWTPCVGPVLASILFYAGAKATMAQGMMLLAAYAIGLGIPFFVAAIAFNWFVSRMSLLRPRLLLLQRLAGGMLLIVGVLLFTGRFTVLSSFFAGFGQLIPLE